MKIDTLIKSLLTKRRPASLLNSNRTFQEELVPILHKLFKTVEREAIFSISFHESNATLVPGSRKHIWSRRNAYSHPLHRLSAAVQAARSTRKELVLELPQLSLQLG